jgi:mersacidin/lichenicidin family type 2 lantibiotic
MKPKSTKELHQSRILLDPCSRWLEHFRTPRNRKEISMESIASTPVEVTVPVSDLDVVRSWKDPRYRRSLSTQQLQTLPDHPAGPAILTDQELKVAGGLAVDEDISIPLTTAIDCTDWTFHNWKSCGC